MATNPFDPNSDILNSVDLADLNTTWLSGASGSNGYTYTSTTAGSGGSNGYVFTNTGTAATSPSWVTTNTIDGHNTLSVKGNADFDSDITVQGRSLTEFMDSVEQRLNILRPNPELEAEWDQLRELGEQYRELERQLAEKSQMWNTLKK